MKRAKGSSMMKGIQLCLAVVALFLGMLLPADLFAFTVNVVDENGASISPAVGYRWLLEEDNTHPVTLNTFDPTSLTVSIPKSHAPVVAAGSSADVTPLTSAPNTQRYILSVMPDSGYTMSGANVAAGAGLVTVTVHSFPIKPAQISVFVFKDDRAVSGIYDIPGEVGLPNFAIHIYDYLGEVSTDIFNNPLGTTYDAFGNPVLPLGNGIFTDATGNALVKNIPPGLYTVGATPRDGQNWIQTTSIGGTTKLPIAVRAGEPPFVTNVGLLDKHIYLGFVLPFNTLPAGGTGTITGRIVNLHSPKPPSALLPSGPPVSNCWVALNTVEIGPEMGVLVQRCNANSTFTINNVPAGTWQLSASDTAQDNLLDVRVVTLANGQTVNLGDVPIGRWFGTLEGSVFYDANSNGFKDPGEVGMLGKIMTLRFRDGSVYQQTATDLAGNYAFPEFLPFGRWLVAEVDFAEYNATGATVVVDNGGVIPANNGWVMPSEGKRTPQPQAGNNPNTGNNRSRTECSNPANPNCTATGRVLTEGIIVNIEQNNRIDWGKHVYDPTPPGETGGISGIVYYDATRAEDDPRYQAGETWEPGIPRVQLNLYADVNGDGIPDAGIIDTVYTNSSDDTLPTGCVGPPQLVNSPTLHSAPVDLNNLPAPWTSSSISCPETISTWNQVRPTVYDGRYAFTTVPPGRYIVEVIPPAGYLVTKEEDKNINFGEEFTPLLLPYPCVGDPGIFGPTVPANLSLFPGVPITSGLAGHPRRLCNMKWVTVSSGQNAATDFSLYTEVPKAGRIVGSVLGPLLNVFNPYDPNIGGAPGLPWVPVTIKDFADKVIATVYTDEWGGFNAMVPSSYRANVPTPSGFSPNAVWVCANSPATNPQFDPKFGEACLPAEAFPGKTAYLLLGVIAVTGSAGSVAPLDCEFPDGIPEIQAVIGSSGGGSYVPGTGAGNQIHITSRGTAVSVPNPYYPDVPGSLPTISRDFGFGADTGTRRVTVGGTPLTIDSWTATDIFATVPGGVTTGELIVTRGDNYRSTIVGITLHVGPASPIHVPADHATIQSAIDAASLGDLILVDPGTYYENIIMWKNVTLQGSGASTIINGSTFDAAKLAAWTAKINALVTGDQVSLVRDPLAPFTAPGQRDDFHLEQGAAITVLAKAGNTGFPRIDGFTITKVSGANSGGGILVNGYAHDLEIANNIIEKNQGDLGGGIRLGWPHFLNDPLNPTHFIGAANDNIKIHHNQISQNGATDHGGGLSIFNGSDNYAVTENYFCGNYTGANGGGVAHYGLSTPGLIANNKFYFQEAFGEGGAIEIMSQIIPAAFPFGLSPGAGNVTIDSNVMQGNIGLDDAAGIGLVSGNGQDVALSPTTPANWWRFDITNNIIVNNLSGFSGAAMNIADTLRVNIVHNTIARNDTTGTSGVFVGPGLTKTTPMTGGIMLKANSLTLRAVSGRELSQPVLYNNIIWQNRSFYYDTTVNGGVGALLPNPVSPYWDLQVTGTAATQNMRPMNSILTYTRDPFTGFRYDRSNIVADPDFVMPYFNTIKLPPGVSALLAFPVIFPLTPSAGDYHIVQGSPAITNPGAPLTTPQISGIPQLSHDVDGQTRPVPTPDRGADEYGPRVGAIYSISGTLYVNIMNHQVKVVTSGGALAGITTTDRSGRYSFTGLVPGTYTVTPLGPGRFVPASRTVTITTANVTGLNFVQQ